MKILIIEPLGAEKSSLAYAINKKFNFPRLNLDKLSRNPKDRSYYPHEYSFKKLTEFTKTHPHWVIEGSQSYLYEKIKPNLIIDMRIHRIRAIWHFTNRFFKAKKLIGKNIDKDLPIQAYHYRKITLSKILQWDTANKEINLQIEKFLSNCQIPSLKCKTVRDYKKIFDLIESKRNENTPLKYVKRT